MCVAIAILIVAVMMYPVKRPEGYIPAFHGLLSGMKQKSKQVHFAEPPTVTSNVHEAVHESHPSDAHHLLLSEHLPHPVHHHKLLSHHLHHRTHHHIHHASISPHTLRQLTHLM